MVKNAAKLAVYEEMTIRAKNHHIPAANRVDTALKIGEFFKNENRKILS